MDGKGRGVIALWIPGTFPGLNEIVAAAKGCKGTGRLYSAMKKRETDRVHQLAKAAHLPALRGPVRFSFVWVEKDRRRDPDNVAAAGRKFILDGLVEAGVLESDGWKHVRSWVDTFAVGSEPGVRVELSLAA